MIPRTRQNFYGMIFQYTLLRCRIAAQFYSNLHYTSSSDSSRYITVKWLVINECEKEALSISRPRNIWITLVLMSNLQGARRTTASVAYQCEMFTEVDTISSFHTDLILLVPRWTNRRCHKLKPCFFETIASAPRGPPISLGQIANLDQLFYLLQSPDHSTKSSFSRSKTAPPFRYLQCLTAKASCIPTVITYREYLLGLFVCRLKCSPSQTLRILRQVSAHKRIFFAGPPYGPLHQSQDKNPSILHCASSSE